MRKKASREYINLLLYYYENYNMEKQEIEASFEREAHNIMVHTNPGFEKSVNAALNRIKDLLLTLI